MKKLKLIAGELKPTGGSLQVPVDIALFPWLPRDPDAATIDIVRDAIAPFALWESRMQSDIRTMPGNYSAWRAQAELEEEHQRRRDANLEREIRSLEETAAKGRSWSRSREKEKQGAYDKGFVGHRAAKLMKRALATERKIDEAIEDRRGLLGNRESDKPLELPDPGRSPEVILAVDNLSIDIDRQRRHDSAP